MNLQTITKTIEISESSAQFAVISGISVFQLVLQQNTSVQHY
jgi:hypothetical protein